MGKYWKVLPLECLCALICLANLAGLPFTLGFFIKHFLIISALNNNFLFYYVGVFLVLSAFTGLFYSYRLYSNVFFDSKKSDSSQYISTSRIEIKSWLFSSTTVSANFAIIGLILCGTLFSFTHFYLLVKLSYLLFLYLILLSFNFWCCLLLLVDGLLFLQMPK
jgi:NADH:ubiquinone oxidoreductase subunit 5 (subunit L)/multisubunit Na+/H+ antiporter MnhA subunit